MRAPEIDFGGQEGAPRRPKWSSNSPRKRLGSGLEFELVLDAVWNPSWGPKKPDGAAGRRNGGGLRGGIKGGD